MNSPAEISLFVVPSHIGDHLKGRYVCLTSSERYAGGTQHWYTEHSLVELSKQIDPEHELDWSFIEQALAEKGFYRSDR